MSSRYNNWLLTNRVPCKISLCHGQTHNKNKITDYDNTILIDFRESCKPDIVLDILKPIDIEILKILGNKIKYIDIINGNVSIFFKDCPSITHFKPQKLVTIQMNKHIKMYESNLSLFRDIYKLSDDSLVDTEKIREYVENSYKKFHKLLNRNGKVTTKSLIKNNLRINREILITILSFLEVGGVFQNSFSYIFEHNKIKEPLVVLDFILGEFSIYFKISKIGNTYHYTKIK